MGITLRACALFLTFSFFCTLGWSQSTESQGDFSDQISKRLEVLQQSGLVKEQVKELQLQQKKLKDFAFKEGSSNEKLDNFLQALQVAETRVDQLLFLQEVARRLNLPEVALEQPPNGHSNVQPLQPMEAFSEQDLALAIELWKLSPDKDTWVPVTDGITKMANDRNVSSKVSILTYPNDKATIKYQLLGDRRRNKDPETAHCLSECLQKLPIGVYYIWAERSGAPTSSRESRFRIVEPDVVVEINEQ